MHIQSTPKEFPTIEAEQELDEPIMIFLETKKHKKKWLYILWDTSIMENKINDKIY